MIRAADPVQEIDDAIRGQKSRRAEAQIELEVAVTRRDKAMADVDQAQAQAANARARIRAAGIEIDKLLEQRLQHVPYQRRPPD